MKILKSIRLVALFFYVQIFTGCVSSVERSYGDKFREELKAYDLYYSPRNIKKREVERMLILKEIKEKNIAHSLLGGISSRLDGTHLALDFQHTIDDGIRKGVKPKVFIKIAKEETIMMEYAPRNVKDFIIKATGIKAKGGCLKAKRVCP